MNKKLIALIYTFYLLVPYNTNAAAAAATGASSLDILNDGLSEAGKSRIVTMLDSVPEEKKETALSATVSMFHYIHAENRPDILRMFLAYEGSEEIYEIVQMTLQLPELKVNISNLPMMALSNFLDTMQPHAPEARRRAFDIVSPYLDQLCHRDYSHMLGLGMLMPGQSVDLINWIAGHGELQRETLSGAIDIIDGLFIDNHESAAGLLFRVLANYEDDVREERLERAREFKAEAKARGFENVYIIRGIKNILDGREADATD